MPPGVGLMVRAAFPAIKAINRSTADIEIPTLCDAAHNTVTYETVIPMLHKIATTDLQGMSDNR